MQALLIANRLQEEIKNGFSTLYEFVAMITSFTDAAAEFPALYERTLAILYELESARMEAESLCYEWLMQANKQSDEITANIPVLLSPKGFAQLTRAFSACPNIINVCDDVQRAMSPFYIPSFTRAPTIYNIIVKEYWEGRRAELKTWEQKTNGLVKITHLAITGPITKIDTITRVTAPLDLEETALCIVNSGVVGTRKNQALTLTIAAAVRARCIREGRMDLLRRLRFICVGVRGKVLPGQPGMGKQRVNPEGLRGKDEIQYFMDCLATAANDARELGYSTPPSEDSTGTTSPTFSPDRAADSSSTEATASHSGIPSLQTLVSWVPETDNIFQYYLTAYLMLQTSRNEALALSPGEAAITGVPTIASNVNGTREGIEDGVTGTLIDLHDPDCVLQYVNAIWTLITNPALRDRLGEAARQRALVQFGKKNFHEAYGNEMLRTILANGKATSLVSSAKTGHHSSLSAFFEEQHRAVIAGVANTAAPDLSASLDSLNLTPGITHEDSCNDESPRVYFGAGAGAGNG